MSAHAEFKVLAATSDVDIKLPDLKQSLRIAGEVRESGAARCVECPCVYAFGPDRPRLIDLQLPHSSLSRLKRVALTKKRLAEEEEIRRQKKEAWFAIPKRFRGKVISLGVRVSESIFVMLSAHQYPNKPKNMAISCFTTDTRYLESVRLGRNSYTSHCTAYCF